MSDVIVQGDSGTILKFIVKDGSQIVDLTNTNVEVLITFKTLGVIKEATITDAINGKCEITLSSDDVVFEGQYGFQATVNFSDGRKFSSSIQRFTVTKKMGYIPGYSGGSKTLVSDSTTNGNIRVDGIEIQVFDDSLIQQTLSNKADKSELHSHTNKLTLDKLSEANGELLYNGQSLTNGGTGGSDVTDSVNNGKLIVDGTEITVYDDTALNNTISGKANANHTHDLTELTDVDVTNKTNGYALQYDSTVGKFISKALPSGSGSGATSLDGLTDVDIASVAPVEGNVLKFVNGMWKPATNASGATYTLELDRWNVKNDGTNVGNNTNGINNALVWAKSQGYNHVIIPSGTYKLRMHPTTYSCIVMLSGIHLELADGCVLELEANTSPYYRIFEMKNIKGSKISGGKIVGDRATHKYDIGVKFVRGGVNIDGSLNDNPNFIRSEVVDRYQNPGLLNKFRLWSIDGITNTAYSFYQYKDVVSTNSLVGYRTNGAFAPTAPTGRGWFLDGVGEGGIAENNKMIFTIDITASPLTDEQIAAITAKVDSGNYTHEWGNGIEIAGSNFIEIENIELTGCTGDGIFTTWLQHHEDPSLYTQEQMGQYIYIHRCDIHRNKRQGISLCSSNDVFIFNNKIHHIGYADDGVTPDGIAPAFGIDIESMVSETNIPHKNPSQGITDGLELNYRLYIKDNYIHHNWKGHFVNCDGNYVVVEGNTFEGGNIGGISSYPNQMYVQYNNNTFDDCELWVEGDNFVNGAVFKKGNLRFLDVKGAKVQNIQMRDGNIYGNAMYGYHGIPTVDIATGTFSYPTSHGMGNGAKVSFEQWVGKVPTGISVDKLYYAVNVTSNSFQVSETLDGTSVTISDAGDNFSISRYDYGRCYLSDVTLERDWRNDNTSTPNFKVYFAGGVIKNLTVKNYDVSILSPSNYVGRPTIVEGLTVIEGAAGFDSCSISDSKFIRIKTGVLGGDITFGGNTLSRKQTVVADNCVFRNVGINLGNATIHRSSFFNSKIYKINDIYQAIITGSYLEKGSINTRLMTVDKGVIIAKSTFNKVTTDIDAKTILLENTDLSSYILVDSTPPTVTAVPNGGVFNTGQSVTLTSNESATIYYTLDGTEPTPTNGTVYSTPIAINTTCTLKFIGKDSSGNISSVQSLSFTIDAGADVTPPENVTGLTSSNTNENSTTLTWIASVSPDISSYDIYNGTTLLGNTTTTSYNVTGLTLKTTYNFTVKAKDTTGNVSSGTTIPVTTTAGANHTGYVNDASLLLFQDYPNNNTTIPNPDTYFMNNEKWTISMTAIIPKNADMLSRFILGGTDNKVRFYRNSNNQFTNQVFVKDNVTNATSTASVSTSTTYTDESSYYHIVIIRDNPKLTIYINNVKAAELASGLEDSKYINPAVGIPLKLGSSTLNVNFKHFAYYNRVLTSSELTQNFNALK